MKRAEHIDEARKIGDDSWCLLHFAQLPPGANARDQVAALHADQVWQRLHHDEISRRIDILIRAIEDGSNDQAERRVSPSAPALGSQSQSEQRKEHHE